MMRLQFSNKDTLAIKPNNIVIIMQSKDLSDLPLNKDFTLALNDALKMQGFDYTKSNAVVLKSFQEYKNVYYFYNSPTNNTINQALKIGGDIATYFKDEQDFNIFIANDIEVDFVKHILRSLKSKAWSFNKYLSNPKTNISKINEVIISYVHNSALENMQPKEESLMESFNFARSLISEPSNILYPESYVNIIQELSQDGLSIEILNQDDLTKLKMNLLLSVAQGSNKSPKVAILRYNGNPSSSKKIALVGKGVTFDSGGISLKPAGGMESMKFDMGGSAIVCSLMKYLALSKSNINAVGIVGLVENMPSGTAIKPGDVVKSYSGKTVEIINTDAEGRLVLADILSYIQDQEKPDTIIDFATLTGAILVALGNERSGIFSNNNNLAKSLVESGYKSGDLAWQMPLGDEYNHYLKSDIADLSNVSKGRGFAGSIVAAMFLKEFIDTKSVNWAHIDIAGTIWSNANTPNLKAGARAGSFFMMSDYLNIYEKESNEN